jgi:hypothetical protein
MSTKLLHIREAEEFESVDSVVFITHEQLPGIEEKNGWF